MSDEDFANPKPLRYSIPGRDLSKVTAWIPVPAESDLAKYQPRRNLLVEIMNAGFEECEQRAKAKQGDVKAATWVADLEDRRKQHKAQRLTEAQRKWDETPRLTAEQIVERLALEEPTDSETGDCVLCSGFCNDDEMVLRHKPWCEYLHALAWVEERKHPALIVDGDAL